MSSASEHLNREGGYGYAPDGPIPPKYALTACGAVYDPADDGDEADWHECDRDYGHDGEHRCHCDLTWMPTS